MPNGSPLSQLRFNEFSLFRCEVLRCSSSQIPAAPNGIMVAVILAPSDSNRSRSNRIASIRATLHGCWTGHALGENVLSYL